MPMSAEVHFDQLSAPLVDLPDVDFAFSYGSGVFPQPNSYRQRIPESPMVDYILGVASPAEWHSKNIEKNPHHYSSWLARLGGKWVSDVAERVGVGVHFNAFVPFKDKTIKYGVIGMDSLVQDILTWKTLYISGRLQKPVYILIKNTIIERANRMNLLSALSVALLLSPRELTEEDLYMRICELSYTGDIRMLFAEDKNKVKKIVEGSGFKFRELYHEAITDATTSGFLVAPELYRKDLQSTFSQDWRPSHVQSLLRLLPSTILERVAHGKGVKSGTFSSGEPLAEVVGWTNGLHIKHLRQALSGIVRASSFRQMLSGILAAGGVQSVQYLAKKTAKAWSSRQ